MKNELGQSVDHFKRAASLAAAETSATVGPTLTAAVDRVQPAATKAKDVASSGWDSAVATITPLVAAATDNARQTGKVSKRKAKKTAKENQKAALKLQKRASKAVGRKEKKGRGSKLLGFALLGTAIGIGAAYAAKRRQAAQWDEYDPAAPITSSSPATGADDAAFEPEAVEPENRQAYGSQNGTVPNTAPNTPR
ncbi:hypothetical protein OWR29_25315 [Actinoplanes sp. Pm04-4]|uniref:Uncharacterized protein n=1 Tax=Paractinoplanes pyxinae TaxID=2997416 RepID=A0ABT4B4C8_9ACTN|nr:hypothetical protein [Actinoplanes pyxinae]MCY1141331.1 hypothetical protein [Actinoplanes pyxinae]